MAGWETVPARLRARGLRWTRQRQVLVEVLARTEGHVTGSELVARCAAVDPSTTPSTVYRTLDVLEELGVIRHGHGRDGRQEFHVLPDAEHGHLHCDACGATFDLSREEASDLLDSVRKRRGFTVDLSHVTIVGRCAACSAAPA